MRCEIQLCEGIESCFFCFFFTKKIFYFFVGFFFVFGLWQAVLQILKTTWTCLGALNGVPPSIEAVASCAFGGAAVLLGTLGVFRWTSYYAL